MKLVLGKRVRGGAPSMKRTTSMTKFTFDLHNQLPPSNSSDGRSGVVRRWSIVSSSNSPRRNSPAADNCHHFLRDCSLCRRRLVHGRDIYMYRGDRAFCSLECRQQQINQDESKWKCSSQSTVSENDAVAAL